MKRWLIPSKEKTERPAEEAERPAERAEKLAERAEKLAEEAEKLAEEVEKLAEEEAEKLAEEEAEKLADRVAEESVLAIDRLGHRPLAREEVPAMRGSISNRISLPPSVANIKRNIYNMDSHASLSTKYNIPNM